MATVTNRRGAVTGAADWYAWGLSDPKDKALGSDDVRAVGVQAFPGVIAFGISTHEPLVQRRRRTSSTSSST